MKKLILLVVLSMIAVNGCAPLPMLVPPTPTSSPSPVPPTVTAEPVSAQPAVASAPMPVIVAPFYFSEGTKISVGDYSERLGTNELKELNTLEKEMAQHRDVLTPEQMFVLAIRLYDLGAKDMSLYWFYEAQFRAKLFLKTVDQSQLGTTGDPTPELLMDYNRFTESAGKFINGYAGCDVDNWMKIAGNVKDDNPTPPELDKLFPKVIFVERSQWQGINDEVGAGLGGLIDALAKNKDAIRMQRVANNLDALYCN